MRLLLARVHQHDVGVDVGPFIPLPDDQQAWVQRALGRFDELVLDEIVQTSDGWPVRIVVTRTDERWQARGFYAFLEHAVVATMTGSRAAVEEHRAVLLTGAPSWTDAPCALVELFDV